MANNNLPRNKTSWLGELAVKDQMRRIWSGIISFVAVGWLKVFFTAVLGLVMQVRKYGVAWRTQTRALKKTRRIYFRSGEYYTRIKRSQKTSLHSFMVNFWWCPSVHDHDFPWSEANISTTATEKTPCSFAAKEQKFSTKKGQLRFSSV